MSGPPPAGFPLGRPARIAVLASGRGSNLEALAAAFGPDEPLGSVVLAISDAPQAAALERARERGITAEHVPYSGRRAFESAVTELLERHRIDVVCLAGFMRLLSGELVAAYAGRIVNIHPSLLPAFRGLHAQRQALAAGVPESGCTVHLVDAGVDTGPILLQRRVPVLPDDDEASLTQRILREEHRAYPEALRRLLQGRARPSAQGQPR